MTEGDLPPLYLRGIDQFNRREFFQCHETWEELWWEERGPLRLFYKGMIQAAVALFHLTNGNGHGAQKLLAGAQGYLTPYRPYCQGLAIDAFLASVTRCIRQATSPGGGDGDPLRIPLPIPEIHLDFVGERGKASSQQGEARFSEQPLQSAPHLPPDVR